MKLIVYSGDGCGACTTLKERLKGEFISFEERNVLQHMAEIRALQVRGIPTSVVLDDNEEVVGVVVGNKLDEIKELIKNAN